MWSIPLKIYREREEKRIKKHQGWTGKESRKNENRKRRQEKWENEGKRNGQKWIYWFSL